MVNVRGLGRLVILAVGLGIGAAVASTPVASADPSTDPFSWIAGLDPGDLSTAASPAASTLDLDISVDGFTLLHEGTATATSGTGDIAIALGADSHAVAEGGFGDYATATTGAEAIAGDDIPDATGNNFDFASAGGFSSEALAGNGGFDCPNCPDTTGSSFDYASASSGSNTTGAFADAGFNGSGDSASAVGQDVVADAGASAGNPANFDSASAWGNLTTPTEVFAIAGSQTGSGGSGDTAFVVDPLSTVGSGAFAGDGFNFDLAGAFGDAHDASATGANFLVDILPSL
jgi:hypothetical protein